MVKTKDWVTKILIKSEIEQVFGMKQSLEAVEDALRFIGEGELFQKKCEVLNPSEGNFSFILPHPAWIRPWKVIGDKWLGCCDGNPPKGYPYTVGNTIINDADTFMPLAVVDAAFLTGMRTAAMAALGAKNLARKDSSVVGMVGCGVQGKTHLEALCELEVFPLKTFKVFDLNKEAMISLKEYGEDKYGVEIIPTDSVSEAVKDVDIACLLTTAREPLITDDMLEAGTHLVATCLWDIDIKNILRNVDKWVLGDTYSDQFWINAQREKYDLDDSLVYGDMSDLVCGKKQGRTSDSERTVMTHLGMGANDVAIAYKAYKAAVEAGVGLDVKFMS